LAFCHFLRIKIAGTFNTLYNIFHSEPLFLSDYNQCAVV
jgi:hypothetical protein